MKESGRQENGGKMKVEDKMERRNMRLFECMKGCMLIAINGFHHLYLCPIPSQFYHLHALSFLYTLNI